MMKGITHQLYTAFILLVVLTVLTGVIYPVAVTSLAQVIFPWQAGGSLIQQNGKTIGSQWIGQSFTSANYFWGRPSATMPSPYNAAASEGSNSGPSNPDFLKTVQERVSNLTKVSLQDAQPVPVDLVTASGSGLDPEISPVAAFYQAPRIAAARNIPIEKINALIQSQITPRSFGVLGEPRVNVLRLNLALDQF